MGVHGLWELLAPVGRRVSVETLAGKKLAIDASIWMVQFMKAMRDEKGEMMRNAHLLGFFRRICKLLFLRSKPVFVFDGATPALKRRTLASRRRHRDAAQAKIRKTAEKLLLSHLKARKLEELAAELKKSSNRKENEKGKQVESTSHAEQEKLDELLAKSLAAEEEMDTINGASTSAPVEEEREDEEEEEEMILNITENNIDPAVLASLPPSMQLDLLVQMRERLMAENRQKYQKIKQAPEKFSELQIQSYLKTVAFRREIDQVQKIAAGKDLGGVQTSKIASETNREFIFSSSFTGDKEMLAKQVGSNGDTSSDKTVKNPKPSDSVILNTSHNKSKSGKENPTNETEEDFGSDVETYTDERGRVRVSRVRALGIRMTRDIQRNLDFMKEYEQEKNKNPQEGNIDSSNDLLSEKSIEISFLEDQNEGNDAIDKIFFNLAADKEAEQSDVSESIWEEGVVEEEKEGNEISKDNKMENDILMEENSILEGGVKEKNDKENEILMGENSNEEDEVDWEDGNCEIISSSTKIFKGDLQEEAFIPEALKRSLEEGVKENNTRENGILIVENNNEGDEVDWEDGNCEIISSSKNKKISKGLLEEDAFIQEAIKRSLEEGVKENNKRENEILIAENNIEGNEIDWEDGSCDIEIISSSKTNKISKGVLEEDSLIQEAIKRSLEDFERQKDINITINTNGKDYSGETGDEENTVEESSEKFQEIAEDKISDKVKDTLASNLVAETSTICQNASASELTGADVALADNYLSNDFNETISETNFEEEISLLRQEQINLGDQRRKLESHAESVSSEMFTECQELLQMFGLPYIIAPTEAEAQCAFMEMNNLVDGVVTDDSDVFLFGARSVYKNIFDDRKYVETYFMKDIESELGLNREMLIRMAMLLGSDYTEGVSGIGIVNAIEVVHSFPEEDGLKKFREWIESPDPTILGSFDNNLKKKSSKPNNNNNAELSSNEKQDIKETFMSKHRNVSKNWHLPSTFPSESVFNAYISPQIDDSKETFSWGKPDLSLLRKLCWDKFGWNIQKADELLTPVLKEYNKHETQLRLEAFYTFNERFAKIRSQRIKKAIKGMTGNIFPDSDDTEKDKNINKGESSQGRGKMKEQKNTTQKGKTRKRKNAGAKQENVEVELDSSTSSGEGSDKNGSQNDINMSELRRSKRQRKEVKYTEEDIEAGDFNDLSNLRPESNDAIDQEAEKKDTSLTHSDDTNNSEGETYSKDYLHSGGGFCADEGNNGEGNQTTDLVAEESGEPGNEIPDSSNEAGEENKGSEVNDGSSVGGEAKQGLCAMPLLKRRRERR